MFLLEIELLKNKWISFDYVNWEGKSSTRNVIVRSISFGSNQWHQQPQWLMKAWDLDKNEIRLFAMKDMSNVINL